MHSDFVWVCHLFWLAGTISRRQIWRVAGRESGSLPASGKSPDSPGSSPRLPRKFPETSPEVLRDCGTLQQSRGSPEVPRTSPEVPRTSPEVSRKFPGGQPFLWEAWHPLLTRKNFPWIRPSRITQWKISKDFLVCDRGENYCAYEFPENFLV